MPSTKKPTKQRDKPPVKPQAGIHYANADSSARLQRVLGMLKDGRPHTTRSIQKRARVCAVGSCVSELRANGYDIECKLKAIMDDKTRIYTYQLQGE